MHILDALDRYLIQIQADGRSPHTRGQYERHIRLLAAWISEEGRSTEVKDVDHETVAMFLSSPAATTRADGKPKKATSVNALRTSLKVFFGYLHDAGLTHVNAGRLIRRARCSSPPPRGLSEAEQERLLAVLDKAEGWEARRDRVLVRLLLGTGIRLGSALAIEVRDVDLEAGEILLRETKGDRPATTYLSQELRDLLREHITGAEGGPLFSTASQRGPITVRQARRRIRQWFDRASVHRGASPHSLRHTFAQQLYDQTRDVLLVKQAMQHRSIGSTLVYARCNPSRLKTVLA